MHEPNNAENIAVSQIQEWTWAKISEEATDDLWKFRLRITYTRRIFIDKSPIFSNSGRRHRQE